MSPMKGTMPYMPMRRIRSCRFRPRSAGLDTSARLSLRTVSTPRKSTEKRTSAMSLSSSSSSATLTVIWVENDRGMSTLLFHSSSRERSSFVKRLLPRKLSSEKKMVDAPCAWARFSSSRMFSTGLVR